MVLLAPDQKKLVPVQLPTLWPLLSTLGLHQDPKGSDDHFKVIGFETRTTCGRDRAEGKITLTNVTVPGEVRTYQQSQGHKFGSLLRTCQLREQYSLLLENQEMWHEREMWHEQL